MRGFKSDASFPERYVEEDAPMPSNSTADDEREAYAAQFEQDVLNAAARLGWEMVQSIIADVKASR